MLAPNWFHVRHRIGPILRGERDDRQYHRLFSFPGYITGFRRTWALVAYDKIRAEDVDLARELRGDARRLVVFKNRLVHNEEFHFGEIVGHGSQLRDALIEITRPEYRPTYFKTPHVGLHIRMGDFAQSPSLEKLRSGAKNSRVPVSWYAEMLKGLREKLGCIPARIVSDGDDSALAPLLAMPNVVRTPKQPSISDLLSLSQAKLVISSGSGFSMWGAFLADAPRICFPGQRFVRVLARDGSVDREPECEGISELSTAFIDHLGRLFAPNERA